MNDGADIVVTAMRVGVYKSRFAQLKNAIYGDPSEGQWRKQ